MPVVRDLELTIDMDDVLRRQGTARARRPRPSILALTRELLEMVEECGQVQPAVAYDLIPILGFQQDRLVLADGRFFKGKMLVVRFASATKVAGVMCTIGPRIDEMVSEYHSRNDDLRALLLDAIGSAALDALGREACGRIAEEVAAEGLRASGALCPGLHGLPLSNQEILYRLIDGGQIGISLTPGVMMVPNKSVSMLIGIGEEMEGWSKAQACDWCDLSRTCAYRVFE